jgi:hypothetical protein
MLRRWKICPHPLPPSPAGERICYSAFQITAVPKNVGVIHELPLHFLYQPQLKTIIKAQV